MPELTSKVCVEEATSRLQEIFRDVAWACHIPGDPLFIEIRCPSGELRDCYLDHNTSIDQAVEQILDAALRHRFGTGTTCPVTGKSIYAEWIVTNDNRPGRANACRHCDPGVRDALNFTRSDGEANNERENGKHTAGDADGYDPGADARGAHSLDHRGRGAGRFSDGGSA